MALSGRDQLKYWGIFAVIFFIALWALGNVLLPFVVGGALAYFLDPLADRLERWGLSRAAATAIIMLGGLALAVLLLLSIIPAIVNQAAQLIANLPAMTQKLQDFLLRTFPDLANSTSSLRQALHDLGQAIQSRAGQLVSGLVSSALGLMSLVVFSLVVPVVTFYLLLDWDHMVEKIDRLLPRDHAPTIRRLASEIDTVLAGFVRGQFSVCLLLGIYYSVLLVLVGLDYGLIVGAIAGALTFIPYIGALIGGVLAIGLALYQFWGDWFHVALVALIFFSGQFIEGNIITPRLVGKSVGLHPVWLLVALAAFGSLFGFVGMLIAVPVSASIGVLMRFGIEQYKGSLLYRGHGPTAEAVAESAPTEPKPQRGGGPKA